MVRFHFHPTIWLNEHLEISGLFGLVSSQNAAKKMKVFALSPARCRRMLCELHEHLQLPVESFAVLLGVPLVTLRKWMSGERNPCGASKRLIWLLHCAQFDPSALRKLDGWLKWAGNHKAALERCIEDRRRPADSAAVGKPPAKVPGCTRLNTIQIRKLRSLATLGEHLGSDIHYIGIAILVVAAENIRQSIEDCEACLALDGLDLETRLQLLSLKGEFIGQQLAIAKQMLELKRDRFATPDDVPPRQTSFRPREQVFPATPSQVNSDGSRQEAASSDGG